MAEQVTMTALDTVHISNVSAENLQKGDVFIVSEADAKVLEANGAAERGGTASKAVNAGNQSRPDLRPETREEIDAERGFEEGKGLIGAPANKARAAAPENAAAKPAARKRK